MADQEKFKKISNFSGVNVANRKYLREVLTAGRQNCFISLFGAGKQGPGQESREAGPDKY